MIDTNLLIAVVGGVLSAAAFFIGRLTAAKNDGQADGELKADVKYIKSSVDKQERKLDEVAKSYNAVELEIEELKGDLKTLEEELKGRLSALEQKVKMLHGGE